MTYPHRQRASGFPICLCGAMPGAGPTSTWGADCPVAMRERIGELERERDEARTELDALLVERTGMDSAGWAAEGAAHDAFMVAENRRGGAVECSDCGRIRFVDGGPDIDLSPSRCQMCERGDKARTAALHEAAAVLRELAREHLDRTIRSGNYMSALNDAASRIEALTAAGASGPREPRMSGGDDSPTGAVLHPAEAILPLPDPASRYSAASDAGIAREGASEPIPSTIYDVEGDL